MKWEFARAATGVKQDLWYATLNEGEPGTVQGSCDPHRGGGAGVRRHDHRRLRRGGGHRDRLPARRNTPICSPPGSLLKERREAGLLGRKILGKQGFRFDIRIQWAAGAYICGEETALLKLVAKASAVIQESAGLFPPQSGIGSAHRHHNVETFCCVAAFWRTDRLVQPRSATSDSTAPSSTAFR